MSRAKKRDGNEKAIIEALQAAGWSVQRIEYPTAGVPDLVVAKNGYTLVAEVKSDGGKLNEDQEAWRCRWNGIFLVMRSPRQAIEDCETILKLGKIGYGQTQKSVL